jgi:hypothetical protein
MQKKNPNSPPDGKSPDSKRRTWPIHAPGQYDYARDGNSWIAFDRVGDFVFDEEHLYVGSKPLPRST